MRNKIIKRLKRYFNPFFRSKKAILPILGFVSLIWFLIRVIPKPSRAAYPCQRAAFSMASAFVLWIAGLVGSFVAYKKVSIYFKKAKYVFAIFFAVIIVTFTGSQLKSLDTKKVSASLPEMNNYVAGKNFIVPQSTVSIVRSNKAKAIEIDSAEICNMVREAVSMAGGFDNLIFDGATVVLKPNLLTASVVDDNFNAISTLPQKVNCVTTDYRIIQAVVNLVREKNPHGKVFVMDGSAIGNVRENMRKMGWLNLKGVDDFFPLDESCGEWRDTMAKELVKISLPKGKALYSNRNVYYLNRVYYEADVLISLPVLKTHSGTAVTGAVKNVGIGATPVNIYGSSKGHPWRYDVISHATADDCAALHNWIHDFYLCRPVDFAIMDGLTGMEYGPLSHIANPYYPSKKNTRCILASKDPIALDAIASLMIQVDPKKIRHLVTLHNDSVGCNDVRCIRVKGMRVDEVKGYYANLATYARYTDFTAPSVSINAYQINDDSLRINLNADNQVVKVEIAIDHVMQERIFVGNFDKIAIGKNKQITDPKQVIIYAYDQYLNCSMIYLDGTSAEIKGQKFQKTLKVYPNPFADYITIESNINKSEHAQIFLYDQSGKKVSQFKISLLQSNTFDLSYLTRGNYYLICPDKIFEPIKIIKF